MCATIICPFCLNKMTSSEVDRHCDYCNKAVTVKKSKCPDCKCGVIYKCSKCNSVLPSEYINSSDNIMISVIGPKASGKSHYIAILINILRGRFSNEFGTGTRGLGDDTQITYTRAFWTPIFERSSTIPPTRTAAAGNADLNPMIFILQKGDKTATIVFFDSAGEDLKKEETIRKYNRYIAYSQGLVFLVDPIQLPFVHGRINCDNKPPKVGDQVATVYENVITSIRSIRDLKPKDKIKSPIAITLTKSDLLAREPKGDEDPDVLLGRDSSIFVQRKRGGYDKENFDQISNEIENYTNIVEERLTALTKANFKTYKYFAVSALGSDPKNGLIKELAPMRVEDPIIWLLYEAGMFKRVKG